MPTTPRRVGRLAKAFAVILFVGAVSTGCGGSDSSPGNSTAAEEDPARTTADARSDSQNTPTTDDAPSERPDPSDPVLGYQISAEPGTVLDVELVAIAQGIEQPATTQSVTIGDEPWQMLFTVFVESAELTVEITDGDAASVQSIRGRLVDPEDPFGGIEVTDTIDSVEVTAGTSATVAAG